MPTPRASIRLATDGKAQVQRDFDDIATSGDAAAKRYATAWERASAQATAAREREAQAAERLARVTSGATNTTNPITGGSYARADGMAQASARAIAEQMQAGETAAKRLLAAVDPLFAAQMRYNTALEEAALAQRTGALTAAQYAQVQTGLKTQLDEQIALYGKHGNATGNARIAQMEFMHAVRGSADQLAAGAPPMQVFAMHMGMLSQSAQLAGGSLGKVGEFLSSGWGIALTLAVAVLAPLASKLFETGETVDSLVDKLKKESEQTGLNDRAHRAFASTLEGVIDAGRRLDETLQKLHNNGKTEAEAALDAARAELSHADGIRAVTAAKIADAQAQQARDQQLLTGITSPAGREFAAQNIGTAGAAVAAAQATLAETDRQIAAARERIRVAESFVAVEHGERDAAARIRAQYEGPDGLIERTRQRLVNEKATTAEIERQVRALREREDAQVKAATTKPGVNAGGTAIFNDQIANFFDIAAKYRGKSETSDKAVLESFFRAANENLDPEKTAWCAAFVNAVLAAGGVRGTGSLAASSFLGFGKDDTHSPQKGDIVIVRSGGSPSGMHVGFLDSIDAKGNVSILGGNTGNKVGTSTYGATDVLGVRRPPTPAEAFADDASIAQRMSEALGKDLFKEQEVTVAKGHQLELAEEILRSHGDLRDLIETEIEPAMKDWNREFERMMASAKEFKDFAGHELDELFNIDNWKDWGDLGRKILHDLEQELIKLALLNPLKNWLLGENNPTLGVVNTILSGIGSVFGATYGGGAGGGSKDTGNGKGNAFGTEYFEGGLTWVGEFGKELVRLPRGSKVTPAAESRRIAAANDGFMGSISIPINIDATGADSAELARTRAELQQLKQDLPGHVIAAVVEAKTRNVLP